MKKEKAGGAEKRTGGGGGGGGGGRRRRALASIDGNGGGVLGALSSAPTPFYQAISSLGRVLCGVQLRLFFFCV